jgi:fatty acid desaturase
MTGQVQGQATEMDERYWYIGGVAHDLSDFAHTHPGGEYALHLGQGRECEPLIYSYHMDIAKVRKYLDAHRLPDNHPLHLCDSTPTLSPLKFTWHDDGFLAACKFEVNKYFKDKGVTHKAGWSGHLWFACNLLLMALALYWMFARHSLMAAFAHGLLRGLLVVQSAHASSHFAFSASPAVNRWVYRICTILIGLWNPSVWDVQHLVAHHIYTNAWPYDTDSAFPIKSIAHNQKRYGYHKYQHMYMWIIYAFTIPLVYLGSLKSTITQRQVVFRIRYPVVGSHLEAWACSFLSGIYLLLPFLVMPWRPALILSTLSNCTASLYFSLQFVVNHEIDNVVADAPTKGIVDWGEYQVLNSHSFAPQSMLSICTSGGLNTQIEHHLFPGVYYGHYGDIHVIVKRVCRRFNIKYNSTPTLWRALCGHYKLLRNPPRSIRGTKA